MGEHDALGVPGTRPCDVSFSVLLVRDRVSYIPDLAGLGSGEASEQALGGGLGGDQGARAEHAGENVVEGDAYLLAWLGADVGVYRCVDRAWAVDVDGDAGAVQLGGQVECVSASWLIDVAPSAEL